MWKNYRSLETSVSINRLKTMGEKTPPKTSFLNFFIKLLNLKVFDFTQHPRVRSPHLNND